MKTLQDNNNRVILIDALRGIAICGIIFMNISGPFKISYDLLKPEWELYKLFTTFFKTKFYTIFSFLFGVGAFIFMQNAFAKTAYPYQLFIKRLIFLLAIGLIHTHFLPGEALTIYAICGFILLPAFRLKPIYNLAISLAFIGLTNLMLASIFSILAMFYLGYVAGQLNVFSQINKYRNILIITFITSTAFAYYSNTQLIPIYYATNYSSKIMALTGIIQSLAYMSAICILYSLSTLFKKIFNLFAPLGRMAFTNYIMQTALMILIANFFNLKGNINFSDAIYIAGGILIFQLAYSHIYFMFFNIGPLEKLWRKWTYSSLFIKKREKRLPLNS